MTKLPPSPEPPVETDSRFPSGPWQGFYLMAALARSARNGPTPQFSTGSYDRRGSRYDRLIPDSRQSTVSRMANVHGASGTSASTMSPIRATTKARESGAFGKFRQAGAGGSISGQLRWVIPHIPSSPRRSTNPSKAKPILTLNRLVRQSSSQSERESIPERRTSSPQLAQARR